MSSSSQLLKREGGLSWVLEYLPTALTLLVRIVITLMVNTYTHIKIKAAIWKCTG